MSKPDWTEAPDQATHYDCSADVFCTVDGYWSCKGKYYHMPFQTAWGSERYTPRPVESATTAWDGTGLPPVGTKCECLFNDGWVKVVVLSVNGDEARVRRPRGSHIVSKGLGNEFRPIRTQAQREREEATDFAARAYLSDRLESAPNLSGEQARKIAAFFYDAGMLKLPEGYRLER